MGGFLALYLYLYKFVVTFLFVFWIRITKIS